MDDELMNVLIVDDDHVFRSLLKLNFEERGLKCFQAENVNDAREILSRHSIDYAVVDLRMPGESGLILIKEIKDTNPEASVLILTGFASHQTAVEAIKLGAIHYLSKPVDFEEILKAFNKISGDPSVNIVQEAKDLDQLQKTHVCAIYEKNHGNISATAVELGLHRRTLQRKLQKWGIR